MVNNGRLIPIYNMGNFNTGKVKRTESKAAMNTLLSIGYKLLSVSFVTVNEYLNLKIHG